VETGQAVSGGYGLGLYGDRGYGEETNAVGFNYFNAEGGLIFSGDSNQIDLYFRYRKQGSSEWIETDKEVYDNV